jgi:Arc/MetJ-type ribon-helix-helix transcriptional regulator
VLGGSSRRFANHVELVRFGVSLDRELLERFDALIRVRQYSNRSEAIRDLIRQELVARAWEEGSTVAGAITYIYDHHQRELTSRVIDIHTIFRTLSSPPSTSTWTTTTVWRSWRFEVPLPAWKSWPTPSRPSRGSATAPCTNRACLGVFTDGFRFWIPPLS